MSKENQKLLQELYHTTNMGIEASQMVLPKVKNQGMKRPCGPSRTATAKLPSNPPGCWQRMTSPPVPKA